MNEANDNFSTPKQTKRLGLRRSNSVFKNSSANKPIEPAIRSKIEIESPASSSIKRNRHSDCRINYKRLETRVINKGIECDISIQCTPKSTSSTDLQRLAVSTNCRPYRLTLSKKLREKMTKKRLEFYIANEMEKEEPDDKEMQGEELIVDTIENNFNTREALLQEIEIARRELIARQEHLSKVRELQQVIGVWKTGFVSALHDLQQKIEPRLETEVLLERLRIPQEMIKYINE